MCQLLINPLSAPHASFFVLLHHPAPGLSSLFLICRSAQSCTEAIKVAAKSKKGMLSSTGCFWCSCMQIGVQRVLASVHHCGDGSQGPALSTCSTLVLLYKQPRSVFKGVCLRLVGSSSQFLISSLTFPSALRRCLLNFYLCYTLQFSYLLLS